MRPVALGLFWFVAFSFGSVGAGGGIAFVESHALAASDWFLLSRHGECADIAILTRKVPDLGDIRDPYAFIRLMRGKGHRVTVNETSTPNGTVVEVTVLEQELALIFVTPAACQPR